MSLLQVLAGGRAAVTIDELLSRQQRNQDVIEKRDVTRLHGEGLAEYVKMNVLACTDELHELMGTVGWKHWKKGYGRVISRQRYVEELADVVLFVMNLALAQGVTGAEIVSALEEKIATNRRRQTEGY